MKRLVLIQLVFGYLGDYIYQVYPQYSRPEDALGLIYYQTFEVVCETISDTLIDTCANLACNYESLQGYYQNSLNQITLAGNTFSSSKM